MGSAVSTRVLPVRQACDTAATHSLPSPRQEAAPGARGSTARLFVVAPIEPASRLDSLASDAFAPDPHELEVGQPQHTPRPPAPAVPSLPTTTAAVTQPEILFDADTPDDFEASTLESLLQFEDATLVQLLYSSRAKQPFSREELANLVDESAKNNTKKSITGALVYINGLFVQALEGPYGMVTELFDVIKRDKRHDNMVLVRIKRLKKREFSEWGMMEASFDSTVARDIALSSMLQTVQRGFVVLNRFAQPALSNLIQQGIDPMMIPPRASDVIIVCAAIRVSQELNEEMGRLIIVLNEFYSIVNSAAFNYGGQVIGG